MVKAATFIISLLYAVHCYNVTPIQFITNIQILLWPNIERWILTWLLTSSRGYCLKCPLMFHNLIFPTVLKARGPCSRVRCIQWTGHPHRPLQCLPEAGSPLHNILSLGSGRPLVITKQIIRLVMTEPRKQYPINYCHKGQQYSAGAIN